MYEGVETGEDEQRHHGTQRHHVVELGLQHIARVSGSHVGRLIGGVHSGHVLQSAGEVLKITEGRTHVYHKGSPAIHH